ncbi:MAG: hypothetical protein K8S98_13050 [Planctomycetes bacterium]|nr:hypothetical protein [Planctomycetota bacterium]
MFATFARRSAFVTALLVPSLSSCIFVADGHRGEDGSWTSDDGGVHIAFDDETQGEEDGKGKAEADGKGGKEDEAADKADELAVARMELEIARLSSETDRTEAANAVARAQREFGEAQKALDHFKNLETPLRLKDGALDVERQKFGVELKRLELQEILAMYKVDDFAKSTSEIVVKRETKDLEFMERELAMAETKYAEVVNFDVPKDLFEKEEELRKADEGLKKAEADLRKAELEIKKNLFEAEHKITKLEKDAAKESAKDAAKDVEKK